MPKDAHFRVSADEIYVFFCSFVVYTANIGVHVKAKSSLAKSKKLSLPELPDNWDRPRVNPNHLSTRPLESRRLPFSPVIGLTFGIKGQAVIRE